MFQSDPYAMANMLYLAVTDSAVNLIINNGKAEGAITVVLMI